MSRESQEFVKMRNDLFAAESFKATRKPPFFLANDSSWEHDRSDFPDESRCEEEPDED